MKIEGLILMVKEIEGIVHERIICSEENIQHFKNLGYKSTEEDAEVPGDKAAYVTLTPMVILPDTIPLKIKLPWWKRIIRRFFRSE